jgi:hypothetical protein
MSASTENFQRRALRRNRLIATALLLGSMVMPFMFIYSYYGTGATADVVSAPGTGTAEGG